MTPPPESPDRETLEEIADRIAGEWFEDEDQSAGTLVDAIVSALRNERERLENIIIKKRDGTMERRTKGYEPEVYYLKYADIKEVCNELLKEIGQ